MRRGQIESHVDTDPNAGPAERDRRILTKDVRRDSDRRPKNQNHRSGTSGTWRQVGSQAERLLDERRFYRCVVTMCVAAFAVRQREMVPLNPLNVHRLSRNRDGKEYVTLSDITVSVQCQL